ncbi:MAG TPA: protein kinase [Gemmatimonadales bacterium]|nr:protein kinase [Gemmatimonadales bacterium]
MAGETPGRSTPGGRGPAVAEPAIGAIAAALAGRYTIEALLGRGATATVWLAHDLRHHRRVALKVLEDALGASVGLERFTREIQVAARLQHPHILPLFDSGSAGGRLWYTMPFVATGSLRDRLARAGRLPVGEAVVIGAQVADALAHAHAQGVVHRDLKPENILLDPGGHALLADFGIAGVLEPGAAAAAPDARPGAITEAGIAVGTPLYMSPEQASGLRAVDGRSDVYALAAVLYEALTGRPPVEGDTVREVLTRKLTERPAAPRRLRPELPAWLDAVLLRALARRPDERYPGAGEFAAALAGGRTARRPDGRRRRRTVVAATLGAAAVAGAALLRVLAVRPSDRPAVRPSVAVLPFKNLGPGTDQYFADGLTEELTSRLAGLGGLRVISRTSAEQYRETTKTLREIGKELGVGYVLEGSVRWERDAADTGRARGRVRVTPQLIRVADDAHLWAETYDAELTRVFQLQSTIAERVAAALDLALRGQERSALAEGGTTNAEAYDYYLRGTDYLGRSYERGDVTAAAELFQRAVVLDPRFALAWARLGRAHAAMYWFSHDRTEARLALARRAADSALALVPDLPDGRLALGLYHYWGHLDYERALEQLEAARRRQPSNDYVLAVIGYIERRRGRWSEAVERLSEAARLDPRSNIRALDLGDTYFSVRRYVEAEQMIERAISLAPDWAVPYTYQAMLYVVWRGDLARGRQVVRDALLHVPPGRLMPNLFTTDRISAALVTADSSFWPTIDALTLGEFAADEPRYHLIKAEAAWFRGHRAARLAHADSARRAIEPAVRGDPRDGKLLSRLCLAYSFLGRHADAIRIARAAAAALPVARDANSGPFVTTALARVYAMAGQAEPALELLDSLMKVPSWISREELRADPTWAPLRDHPRFKELTTADAETP